MLASSLTRPMASGVARSGGITPEAVSLFSRMTVQPSTQRKFEIDCLIRRLKSAGVWSKLDTFYVGAAHDVQAGLLDWKNRWPDLTPVGSPEFTADRGFKGNGVAAELSLPFAPGSQPGDQLVQSSGSVLSFFRREATSLAYHVGGPGAATTIFLMTLRRANGSTFGSRISDTTNTGDNVAGTSPEGSSFVHIVSRNDAVSRSAFLDGVPKGAESISSTAAPATGSTVSLLRFANIYSLDRYGLAGWGAGLSDAQVIDADFAIREYLTAIGAK